MPEEGLETAEIRERLEEAREHAHGGHGGGEKWVTALSLSTAMLAVLAAVASLESGAYANQALADKNDAVLAQAKASDGWSYFQAKSIKSAVFSAQAESQKKADPEVAARLAKEAERYKTESEGVKKEAEETEKEVKEKQHHAEHNFHHHHLFAYAVTIFQVSIGIAAIAALAKRKPLWWASMAIGLGGVYFFARGFLGLAQCLAVARNRRLALEQDEITAWTFDGHDSHDGVSKSIGRARKPALSIPSVTGTCREDERATRRTLARRDR
jgi:hypothetical protein